MPTNVEWFTAGPRKAVFVAFAGDRALRDVAVLTRDELAARVLRMGDAAPCYYHEALAALA